MKRQLFKASIVFILCIISIACSFQTEPINYGSDNCSFCKMTIMDKKFGTELVTSKGKVYKFDDAGCMVKFMKTSTIDESDCKHIVLSSFDKSGGLIPFQKVYFVKSERFQSPMLGNIAAFNSEMEAQKYINSDSTSKSVLWTDLKDLF